MNRRVFAVVFVGVVLAGALIAFNLTRSQPKPPEPVARVEPAAPRSAAKEEPKSEPPPSAPAPRIARRAPTEAAPKGPPLPGPSLPAPETVEATPDAGILRITSDVPGAQVFIDRVFIGEAPVTAANVKPGTHRLNVSSQGFDGVAETLDVGPGPRDILIKLREVRLDATLAVVHNHRIGSCHGQLIATPQGLRYQTADTSDGFSVPLQELETFQVDYLEKRLRLSQKGKRYEFSDPEGNADRLFVFHRDVDKARDRLKKGDLPASR